MSLSCEAEMLSQLSLSLAHCVFLLKKCYYSIVFYTERELQARSSSGFPRANYTLSSNQMAPGAKDISDYEGLQEAGWTAFCLQNVCKVAS